MGIFKRYALVMVLMQGLLDAVCVVLAGAAAAHLGFGWMPGKYESAAALFDRYYPHMWVFVVAWWVVAWEQGVFASRRGDPLRSIAWRTIRSALVALLFATFLFMFFTRQGFDRSYLAPFSVFAVAALCLYRLSVRVLLGYLRRKGYNFRQILLVGANERAHELMDEMLEHEEYGYQVVGVLEDDPERMVYFEPHAMEHLGGLDALEEVITARVVDEVYVCLPIRSFYEHITNITYLCESVGTPVRLIADMFPARFALHSVRQFGKVPLLSISAVPENHFELALKRAMDLAAAVLFMVIVAWWLFPIVALIIKLESRGPVFFVQERVGRNQRRFPMIKFRSMVVNAEELKAKLVAQNEADGPVFKMRHDPRMTWVGRWIRKFSIDELPQFFNVLAGHMSLVGPRPPVPAEVAKYSWEQRRRLSVRPGITGLQQVSGRSDLSFDEWVDLDLDYIDNWSFMEDIRILIRTFEVVVLARGAA